jgi:transglutaminase-like putative cysteine protease
VAYIRTATRYNYRKKQIPSGLGGTRATVREMSKLARAGMHSPEIRQLATAIIRRTPEKNYGAEARELARWVQKNIRYTRDPVELELLTPAEKLIEIGYGDCDDMAILLAALLGAVGIRSRFRLVSTRRAGSYQHVYVEARTADGWLPLDATRKDRPPGWEPVAGIIRRAAAPV